LRCWRLWAGVIDELAAGRSAGLAEAGYRALHRDLLEACRATPGPLGQQIAELVQPWMTLPTLQGIDRATLAGLPKKVHALADKLGDVNRASWPWLIGAFFLFLVAGSSFFLVQGVGRIPLPPATSWLGLVQRNPLLSLGVLVPAALIATLVLLKWLLRAP